MTGRILEINPHEKKPRSHDRHANRLRACLSLPNSRGSRSGTGSGFAKFAAEKAMGLPLGLLTLAAILPQNWSSVSSIRTRRS